MPRLARDDQVVAVDLRALWRALWQDVSWVLVKVFFRPRRPDYKGSTEQ